MWQQTISRDFWYLNSLSINVRACPRSDLRPRRRLTREIVDVVFLSTVDVIVDIIVVVALLFGDSFPWFFFDLKLIYDNNSEKLERLI